MKHCSGIKKLLQGDIKVVYDAGTHLGYIPQGMVDALAAILRLRLKLGQIEMNSGMARVIGDDEWMEIPFEVNIQLNFMR